MPARLNRMNVSGAAARGGGARQLAWWEWTGGRDVPAHHVVLCVHGLTRQAHDFAVLAEAFESEVDVVSVDVAGRGASDWLDDPALYHVNTYVSDLRHLLQRLRERHQAAHGEGVDLRIDWIGTSMGGLIALGVAGQAGHGLSRLVLNDVGPVLEWSALERIGSYVGRAPVYPTQEAAAAAMRVLASGFGPHTDEQWMALSRPMLRACQGGWELHYDPGIAVPFRAMLSSEGAQRQAMQEALSAGSAGLWALYDAIDIPTLLLRGADSDLLTAETAGAMTQRGPKAQCLTFAGVGHAPTLVSDDQVEALRAFLLS